MRGISATSSLRCSHRSPRPATRPACWFAFATLLVAALALPPTPADAAILSITRLHNSQGRVLSTPAGLDCGSACSADFPAGTSVTLSSTGDGDVEWSGACSGRGACVVTMDADRAVSASFDFWLTLSAIGDGHGGLRNEPVSTGALNCSVSAYRGGNVCTGHYPFGTVVDLAQWTDYPSTFGGWSGDCTGNGTTCSVTMDQSRSATVVFALEQGLAAIATNPGGSIASPIAAPSLRC